jgi:E-phenylitaconyl-CoA hydratase
MKEINATGKMVSTQTLLRAIPNGRRMLKTPVIAALHGHCVGMGMTLAIHCDLRYAARDASMSFPEVNHGMISAVSGLRLARLVGLAFASELLLVGERHTAESCLRHGLLNGICDDVHAKAAEVAAKIAAKPWPAIQAYKRLAAFSVSRDVADECAEIEAVREWLESQKDFIVGAKLFVERTKSSEAGGKADGRK